MVIESNIILIFWETIGGIIKQLPIFILVIWGVRILARKLDKGFNNLIKNIPLWIEDYDKLKMKQHQINRALEKR